MKKKDIYTLGALFVLTTLTAVFSKTENIKYVALIILVLSAIKFSFVAFQFMEMKKANSLWKVLIIGILVLFTAIITFILS